MRVISYQLLGMRVISLGLRVKNYEFKIRPCVSACEIAKGGRDGKCVAGGGWGMVYELRIMCVT